MVVCEKIVLTRPFAGIPKEEDFKIVLEDQGDLNDGEIEIECEFISVDPYQRSGAHKLSIPTTMTGSNVARVVASKNEKYPVGSLLVTYSGWIKRGKIDPDWLMDNATHGLPGVYLIPKAHLDLLPSPSMFLGSCGMPGNTAFFGFLETCKPVKRETVVISGAAGAVGSLVGQIAKIKGCRAIGFAGSDEKVDWLVNDLGFDHAFNYKKTDLEECLKSSCPNGVDCLFDGVGGENLATMMSHMNLNGRVAICGSISGYNKQGESEKMSPINKLILYKRLTVQGVQCGFYRNRWEEGISQMVKWVSEGKIISKETVVHGFENTPKAFIGLFTGSNLGKMIVKV